MSREYSYNPGERYVKNHHLELRRKSDPERYDALLRTLVLENPNIGREDFMTRLFQSDGVYRAPWGVEARFRQMQPQPAVQPERLKQELRTVGEVIQKRKKEFLSEEDKKLRAMGSERLAALVESGLLGPLGEMITSMNATKLVTTPYRLKDLDQYLDTETGLTMFRTQEVWKVMRDHGLPKVRASRKPSPPTMKPSVVARAATSPSKPTAHGMLSEDAVCDNILEALSAHPGMVVGTLRAVSGCDKPRLRLLLAKMVRNGTLRSERGMRAGSLRYFVAGTAKPKFKTMGSDNRKSKQAASKLTPNDAQDVVLSFLKPDKPTVLRDLEPVCHMARDRIRNCLALLVTMGKVRQEPGINKKSWKYYKVVQPVIEWLQPRVVDEKVQTTAIKYASDCPHQTEPGDNFCGLCGSPVLRKCTSCGRESKPEHLFCTGCGRKIA